MWHPTRLDKYTPIRNVIGPWYFDFIIIISMVFIIIITIITRIVERLFISDYALHITLHFSFWAFLLPVLCNWMLISFFFCKQAEEQRQAVIDKQNSKLLQRIVDIMTSKKKTFPIANSHETKRKVRKMWVECRDDMWTKQQQHWRFNVHEHFIIN